ncbi:MAG: outer membrane protein assembly factor BamE [Thiomicrorhabdus sp.]|nr:outer membrane protein assembly factor BamE [Thiomicrorhabdus sp.]
MQPFTKRSLKTPVNAGYLHKTSLHSKRIITIGLSIVLLSGCSYFQPYKAPLTQGNVMTQEAVSSLQEGLSKKQVRELLGPPLGQDPFNPNHWEYIFYSANTDLHAGSTKHLVVYFDQDEMLENWKMRDKTILLEEDHRFLGIF